MDEKQAEQAKRVKCFLIHLRDKVKAKLDLFHRTVPENQL
jgi:hypothetical protein